MQVGANMKRDDCIFCKIAKGEIPSYTIYEDESFKVFLDVSPATKGHMLIISKDHYENILELPDEVSGNIMKLAKKMVGLMQDTLGCDGINLVQNNGKAAGQTVFHFHLHLIPRYADGESMVTWKPGNADTKQLEELANMYLNLG